MIYRNDNLEITSEYVKGTIKDIMEYFRYEIAHQSMCGADCDYNEYLYNVHNILEVIDKLQDNLEDDIRKEQDIVVVREHYMGGFVIESESEK